MTEIVDDRQRLVADLRMEADATEELHPDDSEIAVMRQAAVQIERDGERLAKATGEDAKARYYEPLAVLKDMAARLVWSTDLSFRARIDSAIATLDALASPSTGSQQMQNPHEDGNGPYRYQSEPIASVLGPASAAPTDSPKATGEYERQVAALNKATDKMLAAATEAAALLAPPASRLQEQPRKATGDTFATLRDANIHRQQLWDAGNQITLAYRGNELAGEVGEACNVVKKIERERLGIRGSRATKEQLAEELADVVICADLIAMHEGIDLLNVAVPAKFNATSEKVGLPTRLSVSPAAAHGWQTAETAPKNGSTVEWRVRMYWDGGLGSSSGWSLTAMTHWRPAAPPSPQEQEK